MLKVHRISSNLIEVKELTEPGTQVMLIKNYTFTGSGAAPENAPYAYIWQYDAVDVYGIGGQGNPDPLSTFTNHFIVSYSGKYYDPSYGKGPFLSQAAWGNESLAGFCKYGTHDGQQAGLVKKNDEEVVETSFAEE